MDEISGMQDKVRDWRGLVEEQVQSGQSIRVFCEAHQIKRGTFCYWKSKFKLGRRSGRFISLRRFEKLTPGPAQGSHLSGKIYSPSKPPRIHLPNGVQIDLGCDLESAAHFLKDICGVNHAKP